MVTVVFGVPGNPT